MQLERHGSGIHALSSAALKPKFGTTVAMVPEVRGLP
jgi:hypothetical protein